METVINVMVVIFVISMIIYAEVPLRRKPKTEKEISENKEKKRTKCFNLIFSGIFLAFVLVLLAFVTTLSLSNIGTICGNGVVLICYGLIKMSESKKLAIAVLSFTFILGALMIIAFDKLMAISPYMYFYLCGLIFMISILSLFSKLKKA